MEELLRVYLIYNQGGTVIGVISDYNAAMKYIYDNHESYYTWKGFAVDDLLQ